MRRLLYAPVVALLTWEARFVLWRHRPTIVAVTGNMGKTTAKDAIFAAIESHVDVRKSYKSFNSDIGIPLTILGLTTPWTSPVAWAITLLRGAFVAFSWRYPEVLVLEVGADKPGDIQAIARWLRPAIVVYTGVPRIPVHLANFRSREQLLEEKQALVRSVPSSGTVIINNDESPDEAKAVAVATTCTYGVTSDADFRAEHVRIDTIDGLPAGIVFSISHKEISASCSIQHAIGAPRAYAALAACAVADVFGITLNDAASALSRWEPPAGRMRVLRGKNDSIVIDDSYNSSPAAALSALDTLQAVEGVRKIAVLGDMRELGGKSAEAHAEVGRAAAKVADLLITVGEESHALARAALSAGMSEQQVRQYGYDTSAQVGKLLASELRSGDVVLVKGSQNRIRLERCVRELLADRSHAEAELVRQEDAWGVRA